MKNIHCHHDSMVFFFSVCVTHSWFDMLLLSVVCSTCVTFLSRTLRLLASSSFSTRCWCSECLSCSFFGVYFFFFFYKNALLEIWDSLLLRYRKGKNIYMKENPLLRGKKINTCSSCKRRVVTVRIKGCWIRMKSNVCVHFDICCQFTATDIIG